VRVRHTTHVFFAVKISPSCVGKRTVVHSETHGRSGKARKYISGGPAKLTLIYKHNIYVVINAVHKVVYKKKKIKLPTLKY